MEPFLTPNVFENTCPGHAAGPPGLIFTQLIQTLLAAHCGYGNPADYPKDYSDKLADGEEFDFVVVGAGSAGAVIATRLSENPNWKVLLVEAGGDPDFTSDVPAFLFSTQGTDIDWKYTSEPLKESCLGMIDGRCPYPRGKTLGGSSSINAMLYVRGNPEDFNEWEKLGNPGWEYENVLKYFKKSQALTDFSIVEDEAYDNLRGSRRHFKTDFNKLWDLSKAVSNNYHSLSGPLTVSHFGYHQLLEQLRSLLFDAFEELGIQYVADINGKNQLGITQAAGTLYSGTRANTAKMFLNPVKDRPNLYVVKKTIAQKLVIVDNKVTGVELSRDGVVKTVSAKKEVIVSGGALNSPQLLMLSGIGPKEHLESFQIPVVHELKGVGRNLQDHVVLWGLVYTINKSKPVPLPPIVQLDSLYEWLTRRTGLFSSIGITDTISFVNTKNDSDVPDIQYHMIHFPVKDKYLINEVMRIARFKPEIVQQYLAASDKSDVVIIGPTLLRPKSRGRIELRSSNPADPPKIFTNFLTDPEDVQTLIRGVKLALKLRETSHFQYLEPEFLRLKLPECDKLEEESDEFFECLMRHLGSSTYHPVGTCKMGPGTDPEAVVDNKLKVHGISNLRVADASIMPLIVRGNTNAPSIMIGEMVADFIKEAWNQQHTEL